MYVRSEKYYQTKRIRDRRSKRRVITSKIFQVDNERLRERYKIFWFSTNRPSDSIRSSGWKFGSSCFKLRAPANSKSSSILFTLTPIGFFSEIMFHEGIYGIYNETYFPLALRWWCQHSKWTPKFQCVCGELISS